MDYQTENIIQIRSKNIDQANAAFADFMSKTKQYLNDKTLRDNTLFKRCKPEELERVALYALKEVAPSTPFNPTNIELISGHSFPDIVAETHYGVEVKSTQSNSWTSTGSSIIESTRIRTVENIYMLFGKLGGPRAEFECKPYGSCLSNISVTHSPRYQIDMNLAPANSIFSKMNTSYEDFCFKSDKEKVSLVRNYYKQEAILNNRLEMPWWIDTENNNPQRMNIILYNSLSMIEKNELKARAFILFPQIFQSKFEIVALWMMSRYGILIHNLRDIFTAGGQVLQIGDLRVSEGIPRIYKKLHEVKSIIINLLNQPDEELKTDIIENWPPMTPGNSLIEKWANLVNTIIGSNNRFNIMDIMTA